MNRIVLERLERQTRLHSGGEQESAGEVRGSVEGSAVTQAFQSGGVWGVAIFSHRVETRIGCISLPDPHVTLLQAGLLSMVSHVTGAGRRTCCGPAVGHEY